MRPREVVSESPKDRTLQTKPKGLKTATPKAKHENGFSMWVIGRKRNPEILSILRDSRDEHPWAAYLFHQSSPTLISPNVPNSKCRLEPVPFDDCIIDRFFYVYRDSSQEHLAGGGITTRICWDGRPETLPPGWQGAVKSSFLDSRASDRPVNTLVPLLAFTASRFRRQNASSAVLNAMCRSGQEQGFRYAIIPALPPLQFTREYAGIAMEELAKLRRQDGQPLDHWIRVHLKKGAEIIGYCEHSHRFALSLNDFRANISSTPILQSGYHVVESDRDVVLRLSRETAWQRIYADLEREIVSFDWGCVWVRYDLEKLSFD